MADDELHSHLQHFDRHLRSASTVKVDLLSLVARPDVPVKGILADLEPLPPGAVSPADAKIIKDIAFHFA
jgi:hypothetical protein